MPPLGLQPNRPAGAPDITSWGYGAAPYLGPASSPGAVSTPETQKWDALVADIKAAMTASAGWTREQKRLELEDAEKGRANAYKIAELQANTSRYGTDQQTMVTLRQLQENQRQFDASHGLEMQRLGLDFAKTATEYMSTPDRYFQAGDFIDFAGRALQRQGPQPYGTTGTPQPKSYDDFYALTSFGQTGTGTPGQGSGAGGGDPRNKALKAVFDAIPPSEGMGRDANDNAALQAAAAIYSTNLRPGTIERARPGQKAMLESAGRRLDHNVPDWMADYYRSAPGQGRASAA